MKVMRGTDVRFECEVKSDLTTPVKTTWMKDKRQATLGWRYVFSFINSIKVHAKRQFLFLCKPLTTISLLLPQTLSG